MKKFFLLSVFAFLLAFGANSQNYVDIGFFFNVTFENDPHARAKPEIQLQRNSAGNYYERSVIVETTTQLGYTTYKLRVNHPFKNVKPDELFTVYFSTGGSYGTIYTHPWRAEYFYDFGSGAEASFKAENLLIFSHGGPSIFQVGR